MHDRPTKVGDAAGCDDVVRAGGGGATRRFAGRRATAMPGGILVDAVSPPIPCVIRNTSSTGAMIELKVSLGSWSHSAADLPDDLVLILTADGLAIDCSVARRDGRLLGLRFRGPARRIATAARSKPVVKPEAAPRKVAATFGRRG